MNHTLKYRFDKRQWTPWMLSIVVVQLSIGCDSSSSSVNVKIPPDMTVISMTKDCRINSDCEPGYYCSQGAICVYDCREDRDCGVGHTCQSGRCRRPGVSQAGDGPTSVGSACDEMGGCATGLVCAEGMCVEHCEQSGCPSGQICEVGQGLCQTLSSCSEGQCPDGQRCQSVDGTCVELTCSDRPCPQGQSCDLNSGECVPESTGCSAETCPVGTYCDSGDMTCHVLPVDCTVSPCPDGFGCRPMDKRCVPVPDDCRQDECPEGFQCDANSRCVPIVDCRESRCPDGTRCPAAGGQCIPDVSCVQSGCVGATRCNEATGQCEEPGVIGALGEPCDRSSDCASGICTDVAVEGQVSTICVQLCCGEFDCPVGFGCRESLGVRLCMPSRIYPQGYTFDARTGQSCGLGGRACQSGECDIANDECLSTCCTDNDCAGTACVWRATNQGLKALCGLPNLFGQGRTGAPCGDSIDCASGVCIAVPTAVSPGQCGDWCCRSDDCPNGYVCGQTVDNAGGQIVSACVPAQGGQMMAGQECNSDDDCASGHCVERVCREPCCRDGDCAGDERCLPRPNDDGGFARVCVPPP